MNIKRDIGWILSSNKSRPKREQRLVFLLSCLRWLSLVFVPTETGQPFVMILSTYIYQKEKWIKASIFVNVLGWLMLILLQTETRQLFATILPRHINWIEKFYSFSISLNIVFQNRMWRKNRNTANFRFFKEWGIDNDISNRIDLNRKLDFYWLFIYYYLFLSCNVPL